MQADAGLENRKVRSEQPHWRVVVHLNRAGVPGGPRGREAPRWEYRVYPRTRGKIGDILFRFDEDNPHSRIRDARRADSLVLCLCDPDLELNAGWFAEQYCTALKPHGGGENEPGAESAGQILLEATNALLQLLAEQAPFLVEGLLGPPGQRRFELRADDGKAYGFPLGESGALKSDRGTMLLHRWWLFLDHVCRALRRTMAAVPAPIPGEALDARTRLANLLKLRAHLAANLLESESPIAVSVARDHIARYHSSLVEWVQFNLESRSHDEDLKYLQPRYQELGDALFTVKQSTRWIRAVRWLGTRLLGFAAEDFGHWSTTRYFALREAFVNAREVPQPAEAGGRDDHGEDQPVQILDEQWRMLQGTESFFGERYDLREVIVLSRETADVWKQERREVGRKKRRLALFKDLMRSFPWPVMFFGLLVAISWLAFYASKTGLFGRPEPVSSLPRSVSILFGAQYFILYACTVLIVLASLIPTQRIHSLFQQGMPRIFGGMIFGYSPLLFTEEIWWLPLKMTWVKTIGVTIVLIAVSSLYFVFEVAGKVRRKEQVLRKAATLLLVALAQAYGIGFVVTDVLGPHLIMPYEKASEEPPLPMIGDGITGSEQHGAVEPASNGPGEDAALRHASEAGNNGRAATDSVAGERMGDLEAELVAKGELYVHKFPILWGPELWFFPKLLTLWVGLALFFGIFVQILWQKEGILQRISHETKR